MLKKSLISITIAATLSACSGGSDDTTPTPPLAPTPAVERTINGKAIKGVISGATVTVYKYVDNEAVELTAEELTDANVTTGDDGTYSVTIKDYAGPVKIVLSPSDDTENPTTMVCDAPSGCGATAFGETINLTDKDPSFTLSSIAVLSEDNTEALKVNVSALTHLATALVESSEAAISAESIQNNASIIANNFGIVGDILTLEPSIVSAEGVANEDNEAELRYGLINAGIMSAIFSNEADNENVLSTKLAEAIADLTENNGALLVNQDDDAGFELSLADVLAGASEAIEEVRELIQADDTLTETDDVLAGLAQFDTNFENTVRHREANQGDDGRSATEIEVVTEGDPIAKAKAMVSDIRLFTRLFEENGAGSAISEGETYTALINTAGNMIDTEAESFLLLAELSEVLSDIGNELDDSTQTVFEISEYLSRDGAMGTITLNKEDLIFSVDAQVGDEKVILDVSLVLAEDDLSVMLNFAGSIESSGAMLTLAEGSHAKVMFDIAATREGIEEDTYQGEITSGELDLTLTLAQKATDDVTNPVTFTGIVNTTLLPVLNHRLEERSLYNYTNDGEEYSTYYEKETDTKILPEMLTLSGSFSSSSGNLAQATLTVNIDELEDYQTPAYQYIGAEVAEAISVVVSEDKNTVTATATDKVNGNFVRTVTFTPGSATGHWTSTTRTDTDDNNSAYNNYNFQISRSTQIINSEEIIVYRTINLPDENWASLEIVRSLNTDDDTTPDEFSHHRYDGASFNSAGDLIINETTYSVADILDTATASPDSVRGGRFYDSFEELADWHWLHPESLSNAAESFAFELEKWYPTIYLSPSDTVPSTGQLLVAITDNQEAIDSISEGNNTSLNATIGSEATIDNALSVEVTEDKNTVTTTFGNNTRTYTLDPGASSGNFVLEIDVPQSNYPSTKTITSSTVAIDDLDLPELHMRKDIVYAQNADWGNIELHKLVPEDTNSDGITDHFTHHTFYAKSQDTDGNYFDYEGSIIVPYVDNLNHYTLFETSYEAIDWTNSNFIYTTPYNPMAIDTAFDAFEGRVTGRFNSILSGYIESVGDVEVMLSGDDFNSITTGTTTFNGSVIYPEDKSIFENADTFLDVNAALSVDLVLGDYEVGVMLSGERTEFDDGRFSLAMSYNLPNEEAQRSFTVHTNSIKEGSNFSASNAEDVLFILNEGEPAADSDVIGSIVVGTSVTKAADIEDRNGVIVIVYTDGTTEIF